MSGLAATYLEQARRHLEAGNAQKAIALLDRARALGAPSTDVAADFYGILGQACQRVGRHEEAGRYLQHAEHLKAQSRPRQPVPQEAALVSSPAPSSAVVAGGATVGLIVEAGHEPSEGCRIERGRPITIVDFVGNVMSLLEKVLLLDFRVGNRRISEATERYIQDFSVHHGLSHVTVRINQYCPQGEFRLIVSNDRVSSVIRGLLGFFHLMSYVLFPWRLFGGDCYQPMSNSVHLFSDHVGIALHEMGHALDFSKRKYPGLYALGRIVPFLTLYQEYIASRYAIRYLRSIGDREATKASFKILCPAFCTYLAGMLVPQRFQLTLLFPVVLVGHLVGAILAAMER